MTHPAAIALPFTVVRELVDTARTRAAAARQTGDTLNEHANAFLADSLTAALMDRRKHIAEQLTELRRTRAADEVQDRAAARVLLKQAEDFEKHAAALADQSVEQMDAGHLLAARESLAASDVAQDRARRTRHALGILLEHTGLGMDDL